MPHIDISLSSDNKRIELRSPWSPSLVDSCKSIPGANWSKNRVAWTYPLSMATLRSLREVFRYDLRVDDDLMAWAKSERKREKMLKAYASHHDAELLVVPAIAPRLAEAMSNRTYQRSAARFAAVAETGYLLADEPGLGKTATALAGIMEANLWRGDHLIVAPKTSLSATWLRQIKHWTDLDSVYVVPEGAAARRNTIDLFMEDRSETKILLVNPAMLRRLYGSFCRKCEIWEEDVKNTPHKIPKEHYIERGHSWHRTIKRQDWPEILDHEWSSVIVDESHELFTAYSPSNVTQSVQGLLDIKAKARFALTGTPLRGREKHIWGTLNWLGVNTGGYWNFITSYMETTKGFFGTEVYGLDPSRSVEFHRLVDRYVLRRTRAEVRPDLPIGQRVDVQVEMSPRHKKQYEEFRVMGESELEGGMLFGKGLLSELTRMKQLAYGVWKWDGEKQKLYPTDDSPKFEWLMQFLADRGVTGNSKTEWRPDGESAYKYVIVSQFTELLSKIKETLDDKGIRSLLIAGDVSGKRRTDAQEIFQSEDDKFRVMLIQTSTGGVSIDLDAWCDEMVILDETFVADDQVQVEGRINNRSGRISPRMWWYVRTADTVEQRIAESNYSQHVTEHNLLDKRRGVEIALHLMKGSK